MAKKIETTVIEVAIGGRNHRCFVSPGQKAEIHSYHYRTNQLEAIITFNIGDIAEYDSYNLKYTGVIKQITDKGVTIQKPHGSNCTRLKWDSFCLRNWDFNIEDVARHNSEVSMYI